jgi:four helix bundle protein
MIIKRFEDIESWKAARVLTNIIYRLTRKFDDDTLRDQLRRASASIMSNIAEGFDCGSDREFRRFLNIARRSTNEIQSHTYIVRDQGFLPRPTCQDIYSQAGRIRQLIGGFIKYLTSSRRGTRDKGRGTGR